jgi:uracil phosphoribosyltransferase
MLAGVNYRSNKTEEIMQPTAWEIQNRLAAILNAALKSGKPHIDVESAHLHTQVGEHQNSSHRLRREVMMKMMRAGDSIVNELSDENSLTIRYIVRPPARGA